MRWFRIQYWNFLTPKQNNPLKLVCSGIGCKFLAWGKHTYAEYITEPVNRLMLHIHLYAHHARSSSTRRHNLEAHPCQERIEEIPSDE